VEIQAVLKVVREVGRVLSSAGDGAAEEQILLKAGQYAATLLGVALATAVGLGLEGFIPAPSLALIYVLPVIVAAINFGWWPSLTASVGSALAYDFFFTQPIYSLRVATIDEFWSIALLLVIAAAVSALAAQSRSRAVRATRMAAQAEALQALAHTVIVGAPRAQVIERAASTLSQAFGAPAFILAKGEKLTVLASAGRPVALKAADFEAAETALEVHGSTHAGVFPTDRAGIDFWPVRLSTGEQYVVGVDFTRDGRPAGADGVVESVAACLAATRTVG
jgi:K+-sensing histidine kinase KdpD